jgi:predicted chitinase
MASISTHEFTKALQSCEFSGDQVDQHVSILKKYLSESGITSRQELAMFLANVFHESGGLKHVREIQPHPTNYVNNGINYYGRGFLQLTHHYNYRDASRALYGDEKVLLANPELVADQLEVAWRTALWFWKDRVHSKYLKRLEQGDFDASILGINSMELSSTATAQQQEQVRRRRQYYASIRDVLRGGGSGGACFLVRVRWFTFYFFIGRSAFVGFFELDAVS